MTSAGSSDPVASGSGDSGGGVELPQARATEDTTIKAITFKLLISTILLSVQYDSLPDVKLLLGDGGA